MTDKISDQTLNLVMDLIVSIYENEEREELKELEQYLQAVQMRENLIRTLEDDARKAEAL